MRKRRTKKEILEAKQEIEREKEELKYGPPPNPEIDSLQKSETPPSQQVPYARALQLWSVVEELAHEMVGGYPPSDMNNLHAIIREFGRYVRGNK
jgi:hypothetical protein